MSVRQYPSYKDSGIPWLGDVPADWPIVRLKKIFSERDERSLKGEEVLLSVSAYTGVRPRSEIVDVDDHLTRADSLVGYKIVKKDDLVVNIMLAWNRGLGVSEHEGIVSPAYCVFSPNTALDPTFANYVLRSNEYIAYYKAHSTGVIDSRLRIYPDKFLGLTCALPPRPEQLAIAAFLDRETGKIDALVAEQERLIALLKEKRQAVISQAVTKGLDPDVPMKDSGVEWLGEVPAHWEVKPYSKAIWYQEGPGIMAADFHDEGVPLLRVAGVQGSWASLDGCNYLDPNKVDNRWSHFRLRVGDLVISASATMGTVSEVGSDTAGAIPYTGLIRLVPNTNFITKSYVRAFTQSILFLRQIEMFKAGAMIQHFGPSHLRQMKILLPPISEQEEIASYLSGQDVKLEKLTAAAEQAIILLRERRAALISAAVTGKIDVRDLAAQPEAQAA
ncbi:restriction endonuclease subunit S [Roseomonas mucosa]|uniref:restriction endonuclease subunit S n=1 Tax=Roseomonas mucosa TaxID=207340 RepID=UPI00324DF1DD